MLLQPTDSVMGTLTRHVLLRRFGQFLEGGLKRLALLEKYLATGEVQVLIPYGQLRGIQWNLLGNLNCQAAFS